MPNQSPIELHGIGVSPGAAVGRVYLLAGELLEAPERDIEDDKIPAEVFRLQEALMETRRQISELQKQMTEEVGSGEAEIFDAHLLMAEDHSFIDKIVKQVNEKKKNVETIVRSVAEEYEKSFAEIEDDYVRERIVDIRDVTLRLLNNLEQPGQPDPARMDKGSIIIAHDLSPSDTVSLDRSLVSAFATEIGSQTSHSAISARSLEIPAVVGLKEIISKVKHGDTILIDGTRGIVIIHPTPTQQAHYGHLSDAQRVIREGLGSLREVSAATSDGKPFILSANIESEENVAAVQEHGAVGVGLFRSEYLFLTRTRFPTEDEQEQSYSAIVKALNPDPVIIRTLDVGGDKIAKYLDLPTESNPFLGRRGIRLSLSQPEMFLDQLRAILRSSIHGNVKVMFPMVSNAEETRQALEFFEEAKRQLREKGEAFDENVEVGVMIEVPAAALAAHLIAPLVDFFSIGTNDLIQYTFAVDRLNEHVSNLYQPTHPAVLQLIAQTVRAGHAGNCWVGVCGQMASNPILAPLLIGLGVDELSVSPPAVPLVKSALRSVTQQECRQLAAAALEATSADDAFEKCRNLIERSAPEIAELLG